MWPVSSTASRTRLGYLLGLAEVALRRFAEVCAFKRHDALITLAGGRLVKGDGEIALAEQGVESRQVRQLDEPILVETDVAAQLPAAIVADEQVDDAAFGLRLMVSWPPTSLSVEPSKAAMTRASDRMRAIGAG
jgi:hypothetical protein